MTVTYTAEVATVRGLGCFLKLLRRWKGSIYKLVWIDLLVFLSIYYGLNFSYRFLLDDQGKELFESIVKYCREYTNLIPLSFVLGFYVTVVMTRWWNQYIAIPFPDPIAVFVSASLHGQDERGRVMRRTIMRYVCLCVTMMFTMISPRVKKRFPTLDHFIDAGLLQQSEKEIIADLNKKFPTYSKHWLPIVWAASIITRARKEGRIRDDFAVKTMIDELNKFRGQCGLLLSYDTISIPLVYTQVVTLAVYSYFLTTLMGQQWVVGNNYKFDLYFPVFTTLQFFFYVGWLKVAESLINPFGDDDDDFEVNWMIDRNLQVSYLIVDEMHHDHPELVRDQYWDEVFPQELPYTGSAPRENHPLPSTANIAVQPHGTETLTPSSLKLDDMMMNQLNNDLNSEPITFSARSGSRSGKSSQVSIAGNSVPDSISRTNSVTSMFRRLISRENSRTDDTQELTQVNVKPQITNPKISDQIIEEVDEQNTITSQRQEEHPSVFEVFGGGPPTPSSPINVPSSVTSSGIHMGGPPSFSPRLSEFFPASNRDMYDPFPLTASLPSGQEECKENADTISIGSSDSDDFEQLKRKRDQERTERLKQNLLTSLGTTPSEAMSEMDGLLRTSQPSFPQQSRTPPTI